MYTLQENSLNQAKIWLYLVRFGLEIIGISVCKTIMLRYPCLFMSDEVTSY